MVSRQERLAALQRQVERLERRKLALGSASQRYWRLKLLLFLGGTVLVIVTLLPARWPGLLVLLLGLGAFVVLSFFHSKVDASYVRHTVFLRFKHTQLARMRLDWAALPPPLASEEADHPFEIDLDITGEHSLHRLLNTAVSHEGSQRLRQWLLHPALDLSVIRRRQTFVQELLPLTGFRDKLLLHSLHATRYTQDQYDERALLAWLHGEKHEPLPRSLLVIPTLACAVTILLIALFFVHVVQPWACVFPVLFSALWFLATKKRFDWLNEEAATLDVAFEQVSGILAFLEMYPYRRNSQLKKLCAPFFTGRRPSELLHRFARLARRAALTRNPEVQLVVNALFPLDAYTAYQLSQSKTQILQCLPGWLDAWFELEALCSLANFAYLHPGYTFPLLVPGDSEKQPPVFVAQALGHPLIPAEHKVVNDFAFSTRNEIVLLTGSNMSGKSTFLRTLGINLCLAYAGAPVNAASLRTSLFDLYACIKISDSLTDGYSYFYAEVRRLRGLLEKLQTGVSQPVFFLIDEIFKGTNNEERLIGSSAYIHALVGQNCVGVISTHDLELVKLADGLPMLKNYHFREEVQDGRMVFHYQLHQGPCPTRNALKIMQLAGLPISWEALSPLSVRQFEQAN